MLESNFVRTTTTAAATARKKNDICLRNVDTHIRGKFILTSIQLLNTSLISVFHDRNEKKVDGCALCYAILRDGSCESQCDIDLTSCLETSCDL